MALIPQQDVIVAADGQGRSAKDELDRQLALYPDCRIISISTTVIGHDTTIYAVVETV